MSTKPIPFFYQPSLDCTTPFLKQFPWLTPPLCLPIPAFTCINRFPNYFDFLPVAISDHMIVIISLAPKLLNRPEQNRLLLMTALFFLFRITGTILFSYPPKEIKLNSSILMCHALWHIRITSFKWETMVTERPVREENWRSPWHKDGGGHGAREDGNILITSLHYPFPLSLWIITLFSCYKELGPGPVEGTHTQTSSPVLQGIVIQPL